MIKNEEQIAKIKESAKINIAILDYIDEHIKEGISTQDIDDWVSKITKERNAISASLNYNGFPKSVCTSINNVVCHGIPSKNQILKDGDIINVDVSTIFLGKYLIFNPILSASISHISCSPQVRHSSPKPKRSSKSNFP